MRLTESSAIKVDQNRQSLSFTSTTMFLSSSPATTTVPSLVRGPNAEPQAVLADVASAIQTLQIVLQDLVQIHRARVRVKELHAAWAQLLGFDILIWLG